MAQQGLGLARAFRTGLIAGLVFVVLAGVALGAYTLATGHLPGQGRTDTGRALVVAALPDENGDLVAQVIADVDVSELVTTPIIRSVDPSTPVTVTGTNFSHLRDSYAFGGGARTAECYSRSDGGEALPYIDLGPAALKIALEESGGISLELPSAMNVFDGEELYAFAQGPVTADIDEFRAILNGAAYLGAEDRTALLAQVAERITALAANYPGGLGAAIDAGTVTSDMDAGGADEFAARLLAQ
ncbi:MAG: hypothetical protein ACYC77_03035 [Coriobacteriia bacterium]